MGSPASMFGHTFLRIFSKEKFLYSYILNYAAKVDPSNAFLFALKGLMGYYRGYYAVAPFFEKIKEYSGIEGRDLWEYELEVKPELMTLLKLHIYELTKTYQYYYFFSENCSSEVFYLLRILYPEKALSLNTSWTVPVDTLRVLFREGVIKEVRYHPSLLTKIKSRAKLLSKEEIEEIKEWASGKGKLKKGRKPAYYQLSADYVRFLYYKDSLDLQRYRHLYITALRMRSRAGRSEAEVKDKPARLDLSHYSQRLRLMAGSDKEGNFLELSYRPVYHELLDPPAGYRKGSEIVFGEVRTAYFPETMSLLIDRIRFLKITSLEPISRLIAPPSWRVDLGYEGMGLTKERKYLYMKSSGGLTLPVGFINLSIMPGVFLRSSRESYLQGSLLLDTILLHQGRAVSFYGMLSTGRVLYPAGEWFIGGEGGIALHLSRWLSLRAEGRYMKKGDNVNWSTRLGTAFYF